MKKAIIIIFLLGFLINSVIGQSVYKIKVTDKNNRPMTGVKVWMKSSKGKIIEKHTKNGMVEFNIQAGIWSLNFVGLPNYKVFEIEENMISTGTYEITYDKKQILAENEFINKRNLITTFKNKSFIGKAVPYYSDKNCISKIRLVSHSGKPINNIVVQMVSVKDSTIYTNKTDRTGTAAFEIPLNQMYAIDIDSIKNRSFTHFLKNESMFRVDIGFEPTIVKEVVSNDTITQFLTHNTIATSSRSLLRVKVLDIDSVVNVYINQINGNKVYFSQTTKQGDALFLIPNGEKYLVHFDFQRDVESVNLEKITGISNVWLNLTYKPDEKLQFPERYLPTAKTLYLQEFQNFITKSLPDPENVPLKLHLNWGNEKINSNTKEAVLNIGISLNPKVDPTKLPFIDIAFVLDKSGSMSGYKRIEALKKAMPTFIDKLRSDDRIAIVTFNSDKSVDYKLSKKGNGIEIKNIISAIEPSGGTRITPGLIEGYEQLLKNKQKNRISKLILLSDGYGSDHPEKLIKKSDSYINKGISISAVGVGEDYNYALLELLTKKSGGLLEQAKDAKDFKKAFKNQLANIISPVAKNAVLEIKHHKQIVYKKMYDLKKNKNTQKTENFIIGDLFAGQKLYAMAVFKIDNPSKSIENEPLELTIKYNDLNTGKLVKIKEKVWLKWETSTGKYELIKDNEQKKLYLIAIMNQSLKNMVDQYAVDNYKGAKKTIDDCLAQVKNIMPGVKDKDVLALIKKLEAYAIAINNYLKNKNIPK